MRNLFIALVFTLTLTLASTSPAHAQGPLPSPTDTLAAIVRLTVDTMQGKSTMGADQLFAQSQQAVTTMAANPDIDVFFLDFGNPNLRLNQIAADAAKTLLLLTPLYILGYLAFLVYGVWKERPIPNPILYVALVVGVMIFLAAFAVITQAISALGRALALAFGGMGDAMYARAFLDTVLRTLITLQKNGGILAVPALIAASLESIAILIQLAYRGITLAIWRLLSVLVVPFSVLLEGITPKTAGKVISGFFEAWLDLVTKMGLFLLILAIVNSASLAPMIAFVLPAGLLAVIFSWKFFGVIYTLVGNSVSRMWTSLMPEAIDGAGASLPSSAEAARARDIDAARKKNLEE
jgi:hypothetical protein